MARINWQYSASKHGFTLLEVLVVLSILAIVVGMVQLNVSPKIPSSSLDQDRFSIQQWVVNAQQQAFKDQQFRLLVGYEVGLRVYGMTSDTEFPDALVLDLIDDWTIDSETSLRWFALGEQPAHSGFPQGQFSILIKPDGTLEPSWRVELFQLGAASLSLRSDGLNPPYIESLQSNE